MTLKKAYNYVDNLFYDNNIQEEYYQKIRKKSSSTAAFVVGLVAAVGGFLYGYDTGLVNDILEMNYVTSHFPGNGTDFSVHERSLITAILSLGTFIGALIAPFLSDTYGRRLSIIISSGIVFNIGNILQVAAYNNALLCVGRFVSGVSVGILSAIVPLYQAEASPKWVRGSVVYLYQWAITWGFLIASAICQGTRRMTNSGSYRVPIGFQFLWAIILYSGMVFLPESPRFFVQKNQLDKALLALSKLRRIEKDDPDLIEELVEIKASYDYEMSFGKTKLIDCFRNGGGRNKQPLRMLTGMGVQFFQQCSGINFIFYYGVNFFSSTSISNYFLMSFITYAVNTIFTIPGILLIEVIGRRKLLLCGGVGMTISNLIIGIVGASNAATVISSKLSISFACVFISFYASSWGGCAWALTSDLYGISIRQKAISVAASTNWLINFICAYITPYLINTGQHTAALGNKVFFIWGGCNLVGTIFVYFVVYETKGLKLEEVDYMYKVCKNPRESTRFKSTKIKYGDEDSTENSPTATGSTDKNNLSSSSNNNDTMIETGNPDIGPIPYEEPMDSPEDNTKTDYQMYLEALQDEERKEGREEENVDHGMVSSATGGTSDGTGIGTGVGTGIGTGIGTSSGNAHEMTVIATPFFTSPPSDSDESDTSREEE